MRPADGALGPRGESCFSLQSRQPRTQSLQPGGFKQSASGFDQPEDYSGRAGYQPEDRSLRTMYGPHNASAPDGAMFPSRKGQKVGLPQPSGELKLPPPRAAIVQVRVPARFAHVLFDGEGTHTEGTTRYFVTPELPEGKTCHYTVSATWKDGDDDDKKERTVEVKAGHTTVVDFTRPAEKKSAQ